jgi:hypothetical protein
MDFIRPILLRNNSVYGDLFLHRPLTIGDQSVIASGFQFGPQSVAVGSRF